MTTRVSAGPDAERRPAERAGTASRLLSLRVRGRVVPATVVLLVGYVVARALTTGILALMWWASSSGHWSVALYDGGNGFIGMLSSWDVRWYERIALHGYPTTLPVDAAGDVEPNPWAFFPLFPALVRGVMFLTGLGFPIAGMAVAIVSGAIATIVLHRFMLIRFSETQALWGALFFAFGPFSFLYQVGYAETTFLVFVFLSLWFMMHRRYLAMIPFALVASFTHPGALALAAAIGFQGLHRLWRHKRIPHVEWITGIVAISVIVAAALFWPVLATAVTHDASAYFDTELGWWRSYIGRVIFVPFTPFFLFYSHLWGPIGYVAVAVVLLAVVFWMTRRSTRVYGADIWMFSASYMAYLVAVFLPTQSLLRQLLPLSPLLAHPGLSRSHRRRMITLAVSIALQPIAVFVLWIVYPP